MIACPAILLFEKFELLVVFPMIFFSVKFPKSRGEFSIPSTGFSLVKLMEFAVHLWPSPSFLRWNFVADAGGAKADWAEILPATLEAFFSGILGARQSFRVRKCEENGFLLVFAWINFSNFIQNHIPHFQVSPGSSLILDASGLL